MPFAVTAALMFVLLALTTPSEALQSCMTKAEARQHFGSVHLYVDGRDRCWDTTPARKALQTTKGKRTIGERGRPDLPPKTAPDETAQTRWVDRWREIEPSQYPALVRWIEMVQVASPTVEPKAEPAFTPRGAVLAAIAIVLTLATIEVLFRCTIS